MNEWDLVLCLKLILSRKYVLIREWEVEMKYLIELNIVDACCNK